MNEALILELLTVSRRNNGALGITGILLYRDGEFLQVIEGPEANIDTLLKKISRDPRHHCLMPFSREPIAERRFAGFSMAYPDLTKIPLQKESFHPFFDKRFSGEEFRSQPESVYRMLMSFKTL